MIIKNIGEIINIGYGLDLKIKELGDLIKTIVGFEGQIRSDLTKSNGVTKKYLTFEK